MPRLRAIGAKAVHAKEQDDSAVEQPLKQKVRVYNTGLLSELLQEAEKVKAQQAQVTALLSYSK